MLRIIGDLVDVLGRWRVWGGLLNTGRSIATARPIAEVEGVD
jgi:hypothetical protein